MPDITFTNRDVLLYIHSRGRADYSDLADRFGAGLKLRNKIRGLRKAGLITCREGVWTLTAAGFRRI